MNESVNPANLVLIVTELKHKELTSTIIGVYYDVYNGTGRTYPEYIYEQAMWDDFHRLNIACRRQPEYQIVYKGKLVGVHKLDLLIADDVVVELKVVPSLTQRHKAQTISYLKVASKEVGLICNFGGPRPDFARVYFSESTSHDGTNEQSSLLENAWPADFLTPELTHKVIRGLFEVHSLLGPGFVHRIYANAVHHELVHVGGNTSTVQKPG